MGGRRLCLHLEGDVDWSFFEEGSYNAGVFFEA